MFASFLCVHMCYTLRGSGVQSEVSPLARQGQGVNGGLDAGGASVPIFYFHRHPACLAL